MRDARIPAIRGAGGGRLGCVSADNGTVVVVEDDPHIADLVDLYLRREGFRVLLAGDGDKGLEIFKQEDPWIVILDVGLPGARDGFDVCREIRARSSVPVLFLTARDDEVDRILGLELGADDYLVKPFSPRELVARVRAILRRTREGPAPQEVIDRRRPRGRHAPPRGAPVRRGGRAHHPRVRPARLPGQQRRAWRCRASSCSTASGAPTGTATSARSTSTWPSCARSSGPTSRSPPCGASATGSVERCAAASCWPWSAWSRSCS